MSRINYFFYFLFFAYFSTLFFDTSLRNYRIKKSGEERVCIVLDRGDCGKGGGTLKVSINQKEYKLSIGQNDCIEGYYKIGSQVKVLYDYDYDYIILPEDKAELGFYLSLLFFLLPIFCLYKLIKPVAPKSSKKSGR